MGRPTEYTTVNYNERPDEQKARKISKEKALLHSLIGKRETDLAIAHLETQPLNLVFELDTLGYNTVRWAYVNFDTKLIKYLKQRINHEYQAKVYA